MKKILSIIIALVLLLSGCSKRNIEVGNVVLSYLNSLNVKKSKLIDIDYEAISKYESLTINADLAYVSSSIDEVLEPFYEFQNSDTTVAKGDIVLWSCEIYNSSNALIHTEKDAKVLVGSSNFECLEQKMISKNIGDELILSPEKSLCDFFSIEDSCSMKVSITGILKYIEKDETDIFLDKQGFTSLIDFYNYLFAMKVSEYEYEQNSKIADEFLDFSVEKSSFYISEDDLKNYTQQVVKDNMDAATSLGITIEEYYTRLLSLDEDGFYLMCAETAEKEIQNALVIGALSQYNNIQVEKSAFDDYCSRNNIDTDDLTSRSLVEYYCLKSAVIKKYTGVSILGWV